MHIPLPPSLNPAHRSPEAARLRMSAPRYLVPPGYGRPLEVGAHIITIPKAHEAVEVRVGEAFVAIVHDPKTGDVVVLADTKTGIQRVDGYSREFRDTVRELKFGVPPKAVPVEDPHAKPAPSAAARETELDTFMSEIGERNGGQPMQGKDLTAAEAAYLDRLMSLADELKTPSEAGTIETDRLVSVVDDLDGRAFFEVETDETARLVQLAAELDDGATSGDAEVDRLAALGDSLNG
ncbi:hypothetical protein NS183_02895 [Microbacterium testaceum]|uniref:hypothetical protein n=1 Tax=Microbacterium testaceum TaxID=2033 RepID=UPI0007345F12|nr:hypothetical protein [Microbacterium testaceum]KTS91722.1 hypothetical protein NS183_02895 [Microbacterium testaceum]